MKFTCPATIGDTWSKCSTGLGDVYKLFASDTHIFAETKNRIYVSSDNGVTWAAMNAGLPPDVLGQKIVVFKNALYAWRHTGLWKFQL